MFYYQLTQDQRWVHAVQIEGGVNRQADQEEDHNEYGSMPLFVRSQSRQHYLDYMDRPLPLISDKMMRLIEKYAPKIPVRSVVLIDREQTHQEPYWMIGPPVVDCLSDATEYHRDGRLAKLVIQPKGVSPATHLFKVGGLREDIVIVSLALAESLLRREYSGIRLEKVELDLSNS